MTVKISVIIPVYNAEKYLEKCLNSVLSQNFSDYEIIAVDDESADRSLQILTDFAQQCEIIKVLKQKHSGSGAARNLGLSAASGEFVLFLDADDFFDKNMLKIMYQKAKTAEADICFCGYDLFDDIRQKIVKIDWDISRDKLPNKSVFQARDYVDDVFNLSRGMVWNQLYRREFLLSNNLHFAESMSINDIFFTCCAEIMATRICFVDRKFVYYRINQKGNITQEREKFYGDALVQLWKIYDFLQKKSMFEKYKRAYLNFALGVMFKTMSIKEPIKSALEKIYFEEFISFFKMTEFEPEYYTIDTLARKWLYGLRYKKFYQKINDFVAGKKQKIFPIVLACDDNYAPYAGVAIQSILENANSHDFYDIYVLYTEFSEYHKYTLENMSDDNVRITCMNVTNKIKYPEKLYRQNYYSKEMFFRFLLPEIFFGYEKALYLDCDVVAKIDVAEFFNQNVYGFALGGCVNPVNNEFKKYLREKLQIEPEKYINSGVLLFNLQYWQENNLAEKIWERISPKFDFVAPDQDIINLVCKDKIFYLPDLYNVVVSEMNYQFSDVDDIKKQKENIKKAKILHFASDKKPWNSICNCMQKWWHYAKISPFYEEIIR